MTTTLILLTSELGGASPLALPELPETPAPPPDRNPALLYLVSLCAPGSRETQAYALRVIARLFGRSLEACAWHAFGPAHTAALRAYLAEHYAPSTANRYLTALRGVLRRARRLRLMSEDELVDALDFRAVPGEREPPGRSLEVGELEALFATAREDTKRRRGARDAAILALLYGAGLRREEVVRLEVKAFDGERVRLIGKGNKQREVFLPEGSVRALRDWLEIRGTAPGPLIDSLWKPGTPIRPAAVNELLERLVKKVGIKRFTPHDGRRSYATHLLDAGERLEVVQDTMGHSSPATTARYRRDKERARKRSAKLLNVPY